MAMGTCKKIQDYLVAFVDGEISTERYDELQKHLDACAECARVASELALVSDILQSPEEIEMPSPKVWEETWTRIENEIKAPAGVERPGGERTVSLSRLRTAKKVFLAAAAVLVAVTVGLLLVPRGGVSADEIRYMASSGCVLNGMETGPGYGVNIEAVAVEDGRLRPEVIEITRSGDLDSLFES